MTSLKQKIALNLPLNAADCELKAAIDRQLTKPKEGVHFDSDGSFTHYRSMDAQCIVDGVKGRADDTSRAERLKSTMRYEGSVDTITASNWAKECGAAIGTKEWNAFAFAKLKSGNYNKFRAEYIH